MVKYFSSFQGTIIIIILRALMCFSLLTVCEATAAFSNVDLSTKILDPVTTGFMITGDAAGIFGYSVSTAGDIDNDGYDDIIIGAPWLNSRQGAAYVIYGGEKSSMSNWDFSSGVTLDPASTGFLLKGNNGGFGRALSTADINNDGYDDLIIGADVLNSNQGAVYVVYGGPRSSMANRDLSIETLGPLTTGFMITGNAAGDRFGYSVSTAGDINNDGYDDIIIGTYVPNIWTGVAYVIYGGLKSSMANIVLSSQTLDPLMTGFMIAGNAAGDQLGASVSKAGDVNNDGYDDIIVGAYGKNSFQGVAYVIYGGEKSSMSNIHLNTQTLDPVSTGFMITGNAAGDYFGYSVSTAGDLNKDGFSDIIIGAYLKNSAHGAAYVIYGGEKSTMSNIVLSSTALNPTSTGFMITGNAAGDQFGNSVSEAGDVNNDGYDDIIIGANGKNGNHGGAYVIYGGEKSSMVNIILSTTTLAPLTNGFMITGNAAGDNFGWSVSAARDFNKDGFSDIIVGAYTKGAAYLISAAQCTTYCNECSSFTGCTECKNSYYLYQSECLDSCPNATFTSGATCQDCSTHCNVCSSSTSCTECTSPFVLYESYCLESCPKTMFNSSNVCKDCPSYCSSCVSQDSCEVCYQGYTLYNSLCVLSSQGAQQAATQTIASATQGIGSVICVGSAIFPLSALVSKTVQNARYLNISVTSQLAEIYQTWDTDLISWELPNVFSSQDHFKTSPSLFAQYDVGSPFLVNFWSTLMTIGISFAAYITCLMLQKFFESRKYEGWAYSLIRKLVAGSFNFALVQAYACLDDTLFYLVLDIKTNPFNSLFSCASLICGVVFLAVGCLLVFFNFWIDKKYQSIKTQGVKALEVFNEENKYWELFYSDFNDDNFYSQSFFAFAVIRSSLSSFIIAIFYDYPLLQTSYLVISDGAIILFLYFKDPFNTLRGKLAQCYFEIITLLVHLCAFILALQDSFDNPSDTVRSTMSTGIIYLNTALITGAIGFMFIEIYKTIREKTRTARHKQCESVPEDNQETQTLTLTAGAFQPSERDVLAQKRQDLTYPEEVPPIKKFNFAPENTRNLANSDFIYVEDSQAPDLSFSAGADHPVSFEMNPANRIHLPRPIIIGHKPRTINQRRQRSRFITPLGNNVEFSNH